MPAVLLLLLAQDPDLDARARTLSSRLEELRGLRLSAPLTLRPGTRQEYARQVLANARRVYGPDLGPAETAFKALGLIPARLRLDLALTAQAGFGAKVFAVGNEIVLLDPKAGDEWILNKMSLALSDQQFRPEAPVTYDAQMALAALRMGDAEVLKLRHRGEGRVPGDAAKLAAEEARAWERGDSRLASAVVPRLFVRTADFPWRRGAAFALEVHARGGGVRALDDAWARPPASTEQVLHPEKYFAGEAPTELDLAPLDELLATRGRTPAWRSTLGELGVSVLLKSHFPADDLSGASEGWAGDTFVLYGGAPEPLLVWATAWDREEDAVEFEAQALRLAARLAGAQAVRRGSAVLFASGLPKDLAEGALEAAWSGRRRLKGRSERLGG